MSLLLPGGGRHVSLPVHETLHGRGDVSPPPGLLPASAQQLLRLLGPVPPPGRLDGPRTERLFHLLWSLAPDELVQLPGAAQMSRVWTDVLVALLSMRRRRSLSDVEAKKGEEKFTEKVAENLPLPGFNPTWVRVPLREPEPHNPPYSRFLSFTPSVGELMLPRFCQLALPSANLFYPERSCWKIRVVSLVVRRGRNILKQFRVARRVHCVALALAHFWRHWLR